ncbi:hypothetical protein AVEN_254678-1 [Araneus ventricosus]|uniref:Uncharacterized protein n=1 Tax=Araneus ventricosus TaxID=182803 RepID=A0A4Y2VYV5_ARAVE|nr:hypothetical protein AVEN_254678-1 [Araneus ventricosus]
MEGKAIEQACVLTSATSPDVVILMKEIPEHTPDLRVPVEIFHVGNELSKTSSCDPSSCTVPEETERWSSLRKMAAVLLFCGFLLFIVFANYFLYQVLPAETFVQVFSGVYVVVFVVIFLCTIFVKKGKNDSPVNIDEMILQLERDRL